MMYILLLAAMILLELVADVFRNEAEDITKFHRRLQKITVKQFVVQQLRNRH